MSRLYFNTSIVDLERAFEEAPQDRARLRTLADELVHRSTDRARTLAARVEKALSDPADIIEEELATRSPPLPPPPSPPPQPPPQPEAPFAPFPQPEPQAAKPIANDPEDILRVWTALEVLSPPSFVRPERLAGGDRRHIAQLDRGLPWDRGDKAKPGTRVYYQIVLGTVDLPKAIERLTRLFNDTRVERPSARGKAPLAILIVDQRGRPIEDDPVVVASFAWGLPQALAGRIGALADWAGAERSLVELVEQAVRRQDEAGDPLPVSSEILTRAWHKLVEALHLPADLVSPPAFAVRSYVGFKSSEAPEPLLVNSFFLRDLATARGMVREGKAPLTLQQYLGVVAPATRRNLLDSKAALSSAVAPHLHPPGRWPSRGRHSLVLLQQAAVNLAWSETREGGVLGVNGPPGTGKTTLLRDLVAAVVTDRARAMATFDDPEKGFLTTNQKLRAGNGWIHLYALVPSLRGHELLVACNTNKAAENVSAELPVATAVADDAPDLTYFKTISDALLQRESWGLISAVLGNAANRNRFRQTFWWDKEVGLQTYLAAAAGSPQVIEEATDPATGMLTERPPRIVTAENPPASRSDALRRWGEARRLFMAAVTESEAALMELEEVRRRWATLPRLLEALQALQAASALRPGFWCRLLRLRGWRLWRAGLAEARKGLETPLAATTEGETLPVPLLARIARWSGLGDPPVQEGHLVLEALATVVKATLDRREAIGARFVDRPFFDQSHEELHRTTPWLDPATQRLRDQVFISAIQLHKAFIDAAARPIRHNIGALMNVFGGGALTTPEKKAVLPDLWSSLFLVTPVISTTFASMDRMLADLPADSLGWLLIDEAGQATPQSAITGLIAAGAPSSSAIQSRYRRS